MARRTVGALRVGLAMAAASGALAIWAARPTAAPPPGAWDDGGAALAALITAREAAYADPAGAPDAPTQAQAAAMLGEALLAQAALRRGRPDDPDLARGRALLAEGAAAVCAAPADWETCGRIRMLEGDAARIVAGRSWAFDPRRRRALTAALAADSRARAAFAAAGRADLAATVGLGPTP